MKVLVTGAGGFLGTAIATRLVERGDTVRGFSRGEHAHLAALGIEQVRGDLVDADAVTKAAAGCDLVFHVAALPGAWGAWHDYHDTNVRGTEHVLAACRRQGIDRLVYTSTPSVVSNGRDLEGIDESFPYARKYRAHYPATKAIAERMVRAASEDGLRTVSLRPRLVWGPGDPNLLPRLVARSRAGRLRRIGEAGKLIDTTYIDDAADAHLRAAERLCAEDGAAIAGNVYFVSSGSPIEAWEMIDRILAAAGEPPVRRTISRRTAFAAGAALEALYGAFGIRREPPITRWVAEELSAANWYDIGAARRDLGYEPRVSIDEGMERLARWWSAHAP